MTNQVTRRSFLSLTVASIGISALKSSTTNASTMFRGNPQHTFYGSGPLSDKPEIMWKYKMGSFISPVKSKKWSGTGWTGSPVNDEKYVYVGSLDSNFYCLDRFTGSVKWKFKAHAMFKSSPALYAGRIFTGNVDNHFYCINAKNGQLLWKYNSGHDLDSSPAIYNGKVYVGSEAGYMHCFDPVNGNLIWRTFLGGLEGEPGSCGVESSPACKNNRVYATNYTGELFCLDSEDGSIIWKAITGDDTDASCVVTDNAVITASEDKYPFVQSFDLKTGKKNWEFGGSSTGGFWSSPAVHENSLFIGDNRGKLHCLDHRNGKTLWNFKADRAIWSSPAVVDKKVVFGSYDSHLYFIDAFSGKKISRIRLHGRVLSTPCITDGYIYVGTSEGMFYCLR
ncbi:MAG: PQQ-binding-like beta-propeller repeat protein [Deltaproteobacteria bacterium]|nr:PQQ-binding-like beta-propeller repeat protein [Deltaproteobacteria bacterium]